MKIGARILWLFCLVPGSMTNAFAGDEAFISQIELPDGETPIPLCATAVCNPGAAPQMLLPAKGNAASISQQGDANFSSVTQQGNRNAANIAITGSNNITRHYQTGEGNYASTRINGSGSDVDVSQNGGDQSLVSLDGDNYRVEHDLTGDVAAHVETSVTGTLSGPIEVTNSQWGRVRVESK